ncbi:MAG: hypothetical protein GY924_12575 [Planctomycetaceae bacterium]|nr:hypothetical protein [Planctomycetaceae bacterium]
MRDVSNACGQSFLGKTPDQDPLIHHGASLWQEFYEGIPTSVFAGRPRRALALWNICLELKLNNGTPIKVTKSMERSGSLLHNTTPNRQIARPPADGFV